MIFENNIKLVNKEYNDFYADFLRDKDKVKLFTKFKSSLSNYEGLKFNVDTVKKAFKPKVSVRKGNNNKKSNKGIF